MTILSNAVGRARLDTKVRLILESYAAGRIASVNTDAGLSGDFALAVPTQFFVGVNAIGREPLINSVDRAPVVCVYEVASIPVLDDIIDTVGDDLTLAVRAATLTDISGAEHAARAARLTTLAMYDLLMGMLPDPAGSLGELCYATVPRSSAVGGVEAIDASLYLATYEAQFDARLRVLRPVTPRYVPDTLDLTSYLPASYEPGNATIGLDSAPVFSDAVVLGTEELLSPTTAQAAGYTDATITISTPVPDGSTAVVVDQDDYMVHSTTTAGDVVTIPRADLPILDGHRWTITVIHSTTRTVLAYSVAWSLA